VTAWALDILSFKSILMGKANNDADMQMKTLEGIDLLKGLSKEDKQTLCTSMREKVYKAGRMILCEGDEGNTFYIIACAPSPSPPLPLSPPRPPSPALGRPRLRRLRHRGPSGGRA
jgi:hypothetical protein